MGQADLEREYVMRIRFKFSKQGPVKFVGHLDTMRLFQRAVKVAHIPMAYSQGFSPHSLVYFALPLGVGVSSTGEYMDIITSADIDPVDAMNQLNAVLVDGISILEACEIDEGTESLMSLVQAADYEIMLYPSEGSQVSDTVLISKLEENEELIVLKKGKKGIKPVDIKPLVLEASIEAQEEGIKVNLEALAGSSQNLNPDLFIKALMDGICDIYEIQVTRKELYTLKDEVYVPLSQFGCK